MITWNQGDLFVCRFLFQSQPEFKSGANFPWLVDLVFENLAVEQTYFGNCLEEVFGGDKLVTVSGNKVTVESASFLNYEELERLCEEKSTELLATLTKHKGWGRDGGPDFADDFSALD